jgi:hypothetical protein
LKIIGLYEKNKSYFLYGLLFFVFLFWYGYHQFTKYDQMLEDTGSLQIYLNLDGSFKNEKVSDLEKEKQKKFWVHQLQQVDKILDSLRSVDSDYSKNVLNSRKLRNDLYDEMYTNRLNDAQSESERVLIRNSYEVSRLRQNADDLEEDNTYKRTKLLAEEDIPRYESLRAFILKKIQQYK